MKIYYINLDRSTDRLYNIYKQQVKVKTEFTRIPGVDGKLLTPEQKEKNCSIFCQNFCTPGMIGCFMSHKLAWQSVLDNKDEWAIVIEDDCRLHRDLVVHVKTIVSELSIKEPDWDFVYLGAISFKGISLLPSIKTSLRHRAYSYTIPLKPLGFHCYMISKKGATKLLDIFTKIDYHVDLMFLLNNHHFRVFSSKKTLGYQPTTCANSTLNEHNFPKVINKLVDRHLPKPDNVSYSYHLGAPIVKLPLINANISSYIVILVVLLLITKHLRPYIYIYLMYEMLIANTPQDREFIAKWILIFSSFII